MQARRAVKNAKQAGDTRAERAARRQVDAAKHALGERGPPWWTDGDPPCDRKCVENTPYRDWAAALDPPEL